MTATRAWTVSAYSGTMLIARLNERVWAVSPVNLDGGYGAVHWTETGVAGGTSLFGSGFAPMTQALINDPTVPGAWTICNCHGQMLKQEMVNAGTAYMWQTDWDATNSCWRTIIYAGGMADQDNSTNASGNRRIVVYAMGRGYAAQ